MPGRNTDPRRPSFTARPESVSRRGNTLVLVTAILVLLVIIATAFVARSQTTRVTASAQQQSFQIEDRNEIVADQVANELVRSLFPRPVDVFAQANANGYPTPDAFLSAVMGMGVLSEATWSSVPRIDPTSDPNLRFGAQRYQPDNGDFVGNSSFLPADAGDGPDGIFDFNYAPYEVRAWTNWPDDFSGQLLVPFGPGAPSTTASGQSRLFDGTNLALGVGNPRGNPGFGDTRWLRDLEPRRIGPAIDTDGIQPSETTFERFTHWTHLSWIPTAENGWRVCVDISNIDPLPASAGFLASNAIYEFGQSGAIAEGFTLSSLAHALGTTYANAGTPVALQTPYEQWYPNVIPTGFTSADDFIALRNTWFSRPSVHFAARRIPNQTLPNFIDLLELGPPQDEFRPGTVRNVVARTFADTDGDGFTDSFWFVPPSSPDRGVRHIVGVSVIDNGAMLDANVATVSDRFSTRGATPADLGLVTRLDGNADTWVGFFNDPKNRVLNPTFFPTSGSAVPPVLQQFDPRRWSATANPSESTFLNINGVTDQVEQADLAGNPRGVFFGQFGAIGSELPSGAAAERLRYYAAQQFGGEGSWLAIDNSGNARYTPYTLTPFGLSDELELRLFAGHNVPTVYSRFERAVNGLDTTQHQFNLFRSTLDRQETIDVPGLENKLNVFSYVRDLRHRTTLVSGTRNDLRPAWLWPSAFFDATLDYDRDGFTLAVDGDTDDFPEYERRKRRIDLRQPFDLPLADGRVASPNAADGALTSAHATNARLWRNDLFETIHRAMAVVGVDPVAGRRIYQSYLGDPRLDLDSAATATTLQEQYLKTLRMSASYAANIDQWRDAPEPREFNTGGFGTVTLLIDPPLHPDEGLRLPFADPITGEPLPPVDRDQVFIGQEKQPFIMEAFFTIVYAKASHGPGPAGAWPSGDTIPVIPGFNRGGENYVDESSPKAMVVAVQVGNPYDEPVSLFDFKLRIGDANRLVSFGNTPSAHPLASANPLGLYNPQHLYLGPTEPDAPRTAIVFAVIPENETAWNERLVELGTSPEDFKASWIDALDLEPGKLFGYEEDMPLQYHQTLVFDASRGLQGTGINAIFDDPDRTVEVIRTINPVAGVPGASSSVDIVVDRLENEDPGDREVAFGDELARILLDEHVAPEADFFYDPAGVPSRNYWNGVRLGTDDFYVTWARISRIWGWDVDENGMFDMDEISPRYVYSAASEPDRVETAKETFVQGAQREARGDTYAVTDMVPGAPDTDPWMIRAYTTPLTGAVSGRGNGFLPLRGKPTFFPTWTAIGAVANTADYSQDFPLEVQNWDTPGGYRIVQRSGTEDLDYIPMDKGAKEQEDFDRPELWAYPLQMLQKDRDFEQLGELTHVFLWGPVINYPLGGGAASIETVRTFGEIMMSNLPEDDTPVGFGPLVNRLDIEEGLEQDDPREGAARPWRMVLGAGINGVPAFRPVLPAGVGIFDALVLDGRGVNSRLDRNGDFFATPLERRIADLGRFDLAGGYSGRATRGLVNLNTAPVEVMRAMPQMSRVVYNDWWEFNNFPYGAIESSAVGAPAGAGNRMNVRVPESIDRYRLGDTIQRQADGVDMPTIADRGFTGSLWDDLDDYASIGNSFFGFFPGMRTDRGFRSVGELMLLQRDARDEADVSSLGANENEWRVKANSIRAFGDDPYALFPPDGGPASLGNGYPNPDFGQSEDQVYGRSRFYLGWRDAASNAFPAPVFSGSVVASQADARVSTDLNSERLNLRWLRGEDSPANEPFTVVRPDAIGGDAEELNLLFSGISNLVTTRSDVFTVYLKIRTFRQNPVTGIWDATDPEQIVEDARYVMGVDRSAVDSPSDTPKILYFEKVR